MAVLPSQFKIAEVALTDSQANVKSRTRSLITRQRNLTGQAFDARIRFVPIDITSYHKGLMAFIGATRRDNEPIKMTLPYLSDSAAGNKSVINNISAGVKQVELNNTTGIAVGDFFNFAGHDKTYQVTAVNPLNMTFNPNLVRDVAGSETVIFDGCQFNYKIIGKVQEYRLSNDQKIEVEIDVEEVW